MLYILFAVFILAIFSWVLVIAIPVDLTGTWLILRSDYAELGFLLIILGGSFIAYLIAYFLKKDASG